MYITHLPRLGLAILILATVFAGIMGPVPATRAQESRLVWSMVPGVPGDVVLEDVVMVGTELAWAVGRSEDATVGYAFRLSLQGGRWQVERAGTFRAALYGVVALDAERLWLVGDYGLIVRRDATGWAEVSTPSDEFMLRDVQLLGDGSTGWAAGSWAGSGVRKPVMLRYSSGRWQKATIETREGDDYVAALHLNGAGGWAVGSTAWRLQGDQWRLEAMPKPCGEGYSCVGSFQGVRTLDGERAWAVGSRRGICTACSTQPYLAVRGPQGWSDLFPNGFFAPIPDPPQEPASTYLTDLYSVDGETVVIVGNRHYPGGAESFALRYTGGSWTYESLLRLGPGLPNPTRGWANKVYFTEATRGLVVGGGGLVMSYGYGSQTASPIPLPDSNPARPVPNPHQPGVRYFVETGHTVRETFLRYWEQNGGLTRFGYPLTEPFVEVSTEDGRTYTVQYFERARFEEHPELVGTPYEVLLGLLGHWVTAERKGEAPFQPAGPSGQPGSVYFPETGHTMAAEFVGYWQRNGGLAMYGYPISAAFYEANAADGRSYLVQYFERNRFEYHPELAGTPYEVLLGLLGSEYLKAKGWQ